MGIINFKNFFVRNSLFNDYYLAFTLAETLITVAIIGIIAVIVLPLFIENYNQQSWIRAKDNFEYQIEEATKQMNTQGLLLSYNTNDDFVDVLQKYIKIAKRCSSSNLDECFVPAFRSYGGTEIDTSTLTDTTKLGHNSSYWGSSNTVGLSLINGTNILLAYNTQINANACSPPDWYDTSSGSNFYSTTVKNYTPGATTACLSLIYDINGNEGPNIIGKDIGELNASVSKDDCIQVSNLCMSAGNISYSYVDTTIDSTWDVHYAHPYNFWAGARKACASIPGMHLPVDSELTTIWNEYNSNSALKSVLNSSQISGTYWSGSEYVSCTPYAWYRKFPAGTRGYDKHKGESNGAVRCVR